MSRTTKNGALVLIAVCAFIKSDHVSGVFLFGLGLARQTKGQCCHTRKINPCQNIYGKKRVKVRRTACHYATKSRSVKRTMYLGLNIIIKLKFTKNFDRCAILNVLNYLTKNLES